MFHGKLMGIPTLLNVGNTVALSISSEILLCTGRHTYRHMCTVLCVEIQTVQLSISMILLYQPTHWYHYIFRLPAQTHTLYYTQYSTTAYLDYSRFHNTAKIMYFSAEMKLPDTCILYRLLPVVAYVYMHLISQTTNVHILYSTIKRYILQVY